MSAGRATRIFGSRLHESWRNHPVLNPRGPWEFAPGLREALGIFGIYLAFDTVRSAGKGDSHGNDDHHGGHGHSDVSHGNDHSHADGDHKWRMNLAGPRLVEEGDSHEEH